ncbi:lipopolysaccharide-induced tumor necrosis factor-alpha factor homolog isoform X1 [Sipha flava]|uniref:Lipopolysaccharide-induced tumor necrosis factor-alpha factor homolog isoform X1 n=1 Tax=Sipha flava TaxID=143950 RepID=A0A8B8GFC7_9HEMI|nr:lipopolysaccharide-induced tumor necrosis factor-alpha factor homolog isoform X1 [Sipha flava]
MSTSANASIPPLGMVSTQVTCPSCHAVVMTTITKESSQSSYWCCLLLCVLALPCFALVPFCLNKFKDFRHSCPLCSAHIGVYKQ